MFRVVLREKKIYFLYKSMQNMRWDCCQDKRKEETVWKREMFDHQGGREKTA